MAKSKELVDKRVDAVDFCLGTLLGAEDQHPNLCLHAGDKRVDAGFRGAYVALQNLIDTREVDLDLRFVIMPHEIHGDSDAVHRSMSYMINVMRLLVRSGSTSFYQLNLRLYGNKPEIAHKELHIPGEFPTWRNMGGIFLEHLEA